MSRKYGIPVEDMSWSRSKGNVGISASTDGSVLSTPMGRVHGRNSKKGDEEEVIRKRIRVACSRCRKRKIKCSGPIGGDDQPCLNCKNAGTNTTCVFELTGSLKVDMSRIQYPSQDYPYQITSAVPASSIYAQEQQCFAVDSSGGLYQASSYPTNERYPRDVVSSAFTTPLTSTTGYYGYNQSLHNYNQFPNQWSVDQGDGQDANQDHISQWNPTYNPNCNLYEDPVPRVSRSIPSLTIQLPVTTQAQPPFPSISTSNLTVPERTLPNPLQLSSTSAASMVLPMEMGEQSYWPDSHHSQSGSVSSHRSSQETSSIRSPINQKEVVLDQQNLATQQGMGAALYPNFSSFEAPETLSTATSLSESIPCSYQLSDRYHYNSSTPKPTKSPVSNMRSSSGAPGDNLYALLLPYRARAAHLRSLNYEIQDGVPKAPSRIPIEAAGSGRTTDGN